MKTIFEALVIAMVAVFLLSIMVLTTARAETFLDNYQYRNPYVESIDSYKGPSTIYDRRGMYQGRKDRNGSIYNKNGSYSGRIDPNGSIYNKNGAYMGRKDRRTQ